VSPFEKRKQELLARREKLVPEKIQLSTLVSHKRLFIAGRMLGIEEYEEHRRPWVERLAEVERELTDIKAELRTIAEAENPDKLDIPSTKKVMIGRLLSWRDEANDEIKNPRTTPAGKHYAQIIVQRITAIVEAGQ
jgi:hypothetical protein